MEERLQKLMAHAGFASRREAEKMIEQGRVTVNGERATVGDKADPEKDDIRVDGARLRIEERRIYIALYKPMGIVTAVRPQDQETRRTVRELIPLEGHLYPVGRLDADSEGLILMTNDGELAQKLSHPRYDHNKIYEVTLHGTVPEDVLDTWRRGVVLEEGQTRPVDIRVISREKTHTIIAITMREGRKRQIRRIANMFGYPVQRLVRTEFDKLKLGRLNPGEWRYLSASEVELLQRSADSTPYQRKSIRPDDRRSGARGSSRRTSGTSRSEGRGRSTERNPRSERTERDGYGERRRERSEFRDRDERPYRSTGRSEERDYSDRPRSREFDRTNDEGRSERPYRARPANRGERGERGERGGYSDRPPRSRSFDRPSDEGRSERPYRARPANRDERGERSGYSDRPPRGRSFERSTDDNRDERPRRSSPANRSEHGSYSDRPPRGRSFERSTDESREDRPQRARPTNRSEDRDRSERPRRSSSRPGGRSGQSERTGRSSSSGRSNRNSSSRNRPGGGTRSPRSGSGKPRRPTTRRKPE